MFEQYKNVKDFKEKTELITESLDMLVEEYYEEDSLSSSDIFKFVKVSGLLSSILPRVSDTSLSEIDDLLYPEFKLSDMDQSGTYTEDWIMETKKSWMTVFFKEYVGYPRLWRFNPYVAEMTCLQILEQSSPEEFGAYVRDCRYYIMELINYRNKVNICFSIKILRILLDKHVDTVIRYMIDNLTFVGYNILWLANLKNIPQSKSPDKTRMTSWLSTQASIISESLSKIGFDSFVCEKSPNYTNNVCKMLQEDLDDFTMQKFAKEVRSMAIYERPPLCIDLFHFIFMSARNEEERLQYLKRFVCVSDKYLGGNFKSFVRQIIEDIFKYFDLVSVTLRLSNKPMQQIEKYYGHDIKAYLSENQENIVAENLEDLKSDGIVDSELEKDESENPDLIVTKFLIYDDFIKSMNVVSILYTSALKCREYGWINMAETDVDEIFRPANGFLRKQLKEILKTKNPYFSWIVEISLKKCPFLFFGNENKHLIEKLNKIINGEAVGDFKDHVLFADD